MRDIALVRVARTLHIRGSSTRFFYPKLGLCFPQPTRRFITDSLKIKMGTTEGSDTIELDGKRYRRVREGLASVLAPYGAHTQPAPGKQVKNNDEGDQAVFYNPIQQFNRDLSVLAITIYGEGAVLEKSKRIDQTFRKNKNQRKRQKVVAQAQDGTNSDSLVEPPNPRKRKADDVQDQGLDGDSADLAKKPRVDETPDDEDYLHIPQLNGKGETASSYGAAPTTQRPGTLDDPAQIGEQTATEQTSQSPPTAFTILDALSATGLRAFRYAKEIPFATNVVANDLSHEAVKSIELNTEYNEVKAKVHSNHGDARSFMYSKVGNELEKRSEGYVHRFDVIDLDPYGTAAPFFDASLQAIRDGGMLCITCTDAGVFASTGYPEKAYALYAGMPVKGPHSHEGGLRLILNGIAVSAARYGLAIEPLLSLYIDYYARLFVRVHKKPGDVKMLPGTTMTVYSCGHGCGAWTSQPLLRNQMQKAKNSDTFYKYSFAQAPTSTPNCEHCGYKTHLCGPMWAGPLHNPYFVQRMLDRVSTLDKKVYGTTDRLEGMLTLALEEDLTSQPENNSAIIRVEANTSDQRVIPRMSPALIDNTPFFVMPTSLAKIIHCATPSEDLFRSALLGLGYRVSRSHCKAGSVKTNAPWNVLWEIMREFTRIKAPIKEGAVKKGTPGWNILARVRGTERNAVCEMQDDTKTQIDRCQTKEDLKTVLQGMLYRLDNDKIETTIENGTSNNSDERGVNMEADIGRQTPPPQTDPQIVPSKLNIVFNDKLGKEKGRGKLVRYQINPRENWGPMNRAGRGT